MVDSINGAGRALGQVPVTGQKELTPEEKAKLEKMQQEKMEAQKTHKAPLPPPPPEGAAKVLDFEA